ncbi:MAG: lipopolysaccharide biosynthesis protein [Gemmatimonadota bacterium]|nr:lipopolysaccharide biosynthesis protein [Gemmatimonadota bacterium]
MRGEERLFATEDVRSELRTRSVRSGAVTVAARGVQMLVFLGSAMVFARLLTPSDFGVQAMVFPIAILVNNIANLGLQSAIIHREKLDARDANQMFWLALRANLAITGAMALLAPLLERFYHEPRVFGVTLLWAATIYGATLSAVQEALLKRQMRFGLVMKAQLAALVASVIVAVGAAVMGLGYWTLMIQVTVMELGRVAIMWVVCPWRPSRIARHDGEAGEGLTALRRYWATLSGSRALSWLGDQFDRVMVGSIGGAAVLGLYDGARRWSGYAFQELFLSLSDVAVGGLSRLQHDADRYRAYLRNIFLPILSIAIPVMTFIFVDAREVLRVLLGDQWLNADGFVRVMCVWAIAGSLIKLMQWVYMSRGDTDRQLRWTLVSTPVNVIAVLIGARHGTFGVALWTAGSTCALAIPSLWNALRFSPVTVGECLLVFARPALASLAGGALLLAAGGHLSVPLPALVSLMIRASIFGSGYVLAWLAIPGGGRAFRDLAGGMLALRTSRAPDGGASVMPASSA